MCCILNELLGDFGTLLRQFLAYFAARTRTTRDFVISALRCHQPANSHERRAATGNGRRQQQQELELRASGRAAAAGAAGAAPRGAKFEYKMMSKKGLLKFVKYTLIFSNAFGFILSIFLGLFGIAYPDKHFPLSYKGREMALCSLFCMLFTTIGYCGAQNHRRILLIIYGATNVIIVIIVVILWFLFRENSILGNKEISNMFITTLAITIAVMFLFAFILAFHIRTFKDDAQDSIVSQSHQLLQQTTAFLQQQQQHQLQQQAAAAAAAASHLGAAGHNATAHLDNPAGGPFGMAAGQAHLQMQQQQQQQQQLQQQHAHSTHHQPHLPPPHHAMHQQQQQQQDLMMLGHHHQPGGRPLGMNHQQQQAIQMTHIKGPGTSQRNKSLKASGGGGGGAGGQLMLGPAGAHQMTLMRNQSSPLPGVALGPSGYPTGGRAGAKNAQQQQQLYSQSAKHSRAANQPPEPPSPPSPPPPPPPPPGSANAVGAAPGGGPSQMQQPAPPSTTQAQHQGHHHSLRQPGSARMPPACPVQYCTFDCDRTV